MTNKVEITHKTILFTTCLILGLWFLYFIRDILFQLLVSFVIVAAFNPFVSRLEKRKLPRAIAVIITYLIFLGIVGFVVYILVPTLVTQTGSFVTNIPKYIAYLSLPTAFKEQILQQFLVQLGQLPGTVAKTAVSLFSNALNVITVLIMSFYLLISKKKMEENVIKFFSKKRGEKIVSLVNLIENRIGRWAKAEVFLMVVVGSMTYIGLLLLKVPYALPLALLAGLLEIIPMVGPFVAAVPAIIIGFSTSMVTGVATLSLAFLVQQVENYIFVPKIMQKSAGVNPVVTLLALSIGFRVEGVAGALIAIPIVLALNVLIEDYILQSEVEDDQNLA